MLECRGSADKSYESCRLAGIELIERVQLPALTITHKESAPARAWTRTARSVLVAFRNLGTWRQSSEQASIAAHSAPNPELLEAKGAGRCPERTVMGA